MGSWRMVVLFTAACASLLSRSSSSSSALAAAAPVGRRAAGAFLGTTGPAGRQQHQPRRALGVMKSVADLRKEYSASGLEEGALPGDPFPLFRQWLEEAVNAQVRWRASLGWEMRG